MPNGPRPGLTGCSAPHDLPLAWRGFLRGHPSPAGGGGPLRKGTQNEITPQIRRLQQPEFMYLSLQFAHGSERGSESFTNTKESRYVQEKSISRGTPKSVIIASLWLQTSPDIQNLRIAHMRTFTFVHIAETSSNRMESFQHTSRMPRNRQKHPEHYLPSHPKIQSQHMLRIPKRPN